MEVKEESSVSCPYLGTIRRHLIDFDLEQVCCVSMSTNNVYVCLVCGKYYQGKGMTTPAFQHSIEANHHLFIHLSTGVISCLPDNYEVTSHTIKDIQFNLNPQFQINDLESLYSYSVQYNIDGKQYIPGIVGMNNLKGTDYANSVFQMLNTIKPFREFLLLADHFEDLLINRYATFTKRIWNWKQFKGSISPHELMQAITERSNKTYRIGIKSDPGNFIVWLIDNLQRSIKKSKISNFNLVNLFQGTIKTSYIKGIKNSAEYESAPTKVEDKTFTVIKLQFPERGIFNKVENQIDINDMLSYYLGQKGKIQGEGLRFMRITSFPRFLVLVFKRFYSNDYTIEKDTSQVIYSGNLEIEGQKYRLISQICHQGKHETGSYKCSVLMGEKWFEAEDLLINEVLKKQMLLGEPYIQMYEKIN